ncbi:MAG: deoxyribodipyrimidine photo-lyase [Chloroflexi bacterium]|nr:deoxyribodipyrimidine photo-lyase [Ardenticatenaceae bacterium]MBL1129549.1 deoxyribodipyrimidine photo-lyase [Chloroflexota bacterium]NOG35631.1 deoxyribodipyrimidine photo-lyase [Chloroflexota bacterium]GIK58484.1 MAG: deoxyribodipyrimidine photo-lyase [Chloroflexota bacterium]
MSTAVWWIRRDLRLSDNQALTAACRAADQVIPLFILDPFFARSPYVADKRLAFLYGGLAELDAALRQRDGRLIIRLGEPTAVLTRLLAETNAHAIFAEADYSAYARWRDTAVAHTLPLHLTDGLTVHHPATLVKQNGTPYTVFTPFKKNWLAQPLAARPLPIPTHINTSPDIASLPLPTPPITPTFPPGETAARHRLTTFTSPYPFTPPPAHSISHYAAQRDQLAEPATSQLSPYLRFGMISARQAAWAAQDALTAAPHAAAKGAETWLSQLIWRDFYMVILYHFPHVARGSFRPAYDAIPWRNDPAEFAAWQAGQTGYPVVDAAMRQLTQTGWMHNRARMIVASFLVKDLLIDWRWGERYFMQQLVDGDPANNNGGWQWTAGTGTDAAPYFRIFNPVSQSQKFDRHGRYLRTWLPELANLPDATIHAPWLMPPLEQQRLGFMIGRDYPAPIVDRTQTRPRTLAAYQHIRQT